MLNRENNSHLTVAHMRTRRAEALQIRTAC